MNANEMADELAKVPIEIFGKVRMVDVRVMLRQQQAEIEALKMGFANNGTSNSELAEVRALANRWFLNANRYQWLRNEFANGRETYLAEGIPSEDKLDKYIDEQIRKAQEK